MNKIVDSQSNEADDRSVPQLIDGLFAVNYRSSFDDKMKPYSNEACG